MSTYLFSLGLVPVQSWIAEARRSRDLRAGSVFLWRGMAKLLAELQEKHSAEILLPREMEGVEFKRLAKLSFSAALGETYGIPNRAAGYLGAGDEIQVKEVFRSLNEEVLLRTWQSLKEGHLAEERLPARLWHELLKAPVEAYLERTRGGEDCPLSLLWVARKLQGPRRAAEDLAAIERLFADVKRTRPVAAWTAAGRAGKCNQCGRREAIGPDSDFTAWQRFHGKLREERWVRRGVRIDAGERLCYVCFARRLAGYSQTTPFRSTGEVAACHWARRVKAEPALAQLFAELKEAVEDEKVRFGGGDLYRALHARAAELERLELAEVATRRQALLEAIKNWNRAHPETRVAKQPPSYLAVLTFDGDDMGRWIQEEFPRGPELLGNFARRANMMLRRLGAEIFYLAGDEGLAMLPAASALPAALGLRDLFHNFVAAGEDKPTLSAGLAFFDQSRPMAGAIRAAREALKTAKEMEGKNALGAAVETASGSRWRFAEHWGPPWNRIQGTVAQVQDRNLSPGWAFDVERLLNTLPLESWGAERWQDDRLRAAVLVEVERLFVRRLSSKVGKTPEKRRLWRELDGPGWWQRRSSGDVPEPHPEQFHLIGFLASHAAQGAGIGIEPEP